MNRVSILVFAFAAILAAQDKITVPLSSPSQPATVNARLISGSIAVTGGAGPQVVVESQAASRDRDRKNNPLSDAIRAQIQAATGGRGRDRDTAIPPGMHRIDTGGHGFNVEEDHNVVTVIPDNDGRGMNLALQVPVNTSVELKT